MDSEQGEQDILQQDNILKASESKIRKNLKIMAAVFKMLYCKPRGAPH